MSDPLYVDDAGEWRWRIRADNGEIVADSAEGYKKRPDAVHGMRVALRELREIADSLGVEES